MTTPTTAPPPRDQTITIRVSPEERLEFDLVAARAREPISVAVRALVRERAEEIRAARREAERFRRGEWGGKEREAKS